MATGGCVLRLSWAILHDGVPLDLLAARCAPDPSPGSSIVNFSEGLLSTIYVRLEAVRHVRGRWGLVSGTSGRYGAHIVPRTPGMYTTARPSAQAWLPTGIRTHLLRGKTGRRMGRLTPEGKCYAVGCLRTKGAHIALCLFDV